MTNKQAIIFDLDGTLLDTIADIAFAVNKVLEEFNLPTHSLSSYKRFVGEGIEILTQKVLPKETLKNEKYNQIFRRILEEYEKGLLIETKPYPNIPELLKKLTEQEIPFAVLSNKPERFVQISVQKLLPAYPFKAVWGQTQSHPPKPNPLKALLLAKLFDLPSHVIYFVGDSEIDIRTARNAGMKAVAVSWGFRSKEDLQKSNPDWLIDKPLEVFNLLEKHF